MRADAADLIRAAELDEQAAAAAEAVRDAANAQAASLQSQANALTARALTTPAWQFVGALWSPLTAFLASPPGTSFDGIDGGLIGDALARGGERVIVNSLFLSLTLSDALQLIEQTEFLNTLLTRTMVGYGSGGIIGGTPRGLPPTTDVPEPPMTSLALAALLALGVVRRKGGCDQQAADKREVGLPRADGVGTRRVLHAPEVEEQQRRQDREQDQSQRSPRRIKPDDQRDTAHGLKDGSRQQHHARCRNTSRRDRSCKRSCRSEVVNSRRGEICAEQQATENPQNVENSHCSYSSCCVTRMVTRVAMRIVTRRLVAMVQDRAASVVARNRARRGKSKTA